MTISICLTALLLVLLLGSAVNVLYLFELLPAALVQGGLMIVLLFAVANLLNLTLRKKDEEQEEKPRRRPGETERSAYAALVLLFLATYVMTML